MLRASACHQGEYNCLFCRRKTPRHHPCSSSACLGALAQPAKRNFPLANTSPDHTAHPRCPPWRLLLLLTPVPAAVVVFCPTLLRGWSSGLLIDSRVRRQVKPGKRRAKLAGRRRQQPRLLAQLRCRNLSDQMASMRWAQQHRRPSCCPREGATRERLGRRRLSCASDRSP